MPTEASEINDPAAGSGTEPAPASARPRSKALANSLPYCAVSRDELSGGAVGSYKAPSTVTSSPSVLELAKEAMPPAPFQGALAKSVPPRPLINAARVAARGEGLVPNWMMSLESLRSKVELGVKVGRAARLLVEALPREPA